MSSDGESESVTAHVGLIVCGPCACGKSEVASALARHYQVPFVDADAFHSETNIKKMSSGIPLTDQDRFPWLEVVRQQMILQKTKAKESQNTPCVGVVAACSALTQKYRNILRGNPPPDSKSPQTTGQLRVIFVFLKCSKEVLQQRLDSRQGHFMKGNMLASQLATLEIPHEEEKRGQAVIVNGDAELSSVLTEATEKIGAILQS